MQTHMITTTTNNKQQQTTASQDGPEEGAGGRAHALEGEIEIFWTPASAGTEPSQG